MELRITDLEIRITHQQKTIDELNDTVYRQELAIVRLEQEMQTIRKQVQLLLPSLMTTGNEEEIPPHY